jgi:hypothetical protein
MNCKLLKFCGLPILLFFFICDSFAQKDDQATTRAPVVAAAEDSMNSDYEDAGDTVIGKTAFTSTADSIAKFKRFREFGYMVYLDSLLRRKTDLRIDTISIEKGIVNKNRGSANSTADLNSKSFLNSFPVKFFFWTLAVFFIGFILYKLFFTNGLFTTENTKAIDEPAGKEQEVLNEYSQYNVLIREAEGKNDFNLSVRYMYLQSLKKLSDGGLIVFSPDKTNNLYVQELDGQYLRHEFALLTLNYEYVWYGRFTIDTVQYQKIKEQFILFNKKV